MTTFSGRQRLLGMPSKLRAIFLAISTGVLQAPPSKGNGITGATMLYLFFPALGAGCPGSLALRPLQRLLGDVFVALFPSTRSSAVGSTRLAAYMINVSSQRKPERKQFTSELCASCLDEGSTRLREGRLGPLVHLCSSQSSPLRST